MNIGAGSSGFSYLPNELISEILVSLFNQYEAHQYDERSEFPWRSRQVCRKWRDVINQTSALWTVLCLHYPSIGSLKRFDERIQLSGLRELDVVIELRSTPSPSKTATLDVSLEDLHISRWRSIQFIFLYRPEKWRPGVYDAIFSHPMPKLQTLFFGVRTCHTSDDHALGCYVGLPRRSLPPSLRTLRLKHYSMSFDRGYADGLEYLEIDRVEHLGFFEGFIKFIQHLPQLRTLRLCSSTIRAWYEDTEEWYQRHLRSKCLHLLKLENLSITRMGQWDGVLMLSLIEAPLLTTLELDLHQDTTRAALMAWEEPDVPLIGFPSLRLLKLGLVEIRHPVRTHIIMRLLSSTDTVRQLILDGGSQEHCKPFFKYPLKFLGILQQLQSPCFQGMLAGLEDFAVRNCSPVVLYDFYERNNLSSLTSFRVSAWEIDMIDGVASYEYIWMEELSHRTVDTVEKLRALSVFGIWRQEDCLPRQTDY